MSSKSVAVEIRGLSKRYMISHQEKHRYLGDALLEKLKNPFAKPTKEEFWALKDVSFDVDAGEVLGIVGRNGAGKSTMLKILSGIAEPTSGEIRLHGKVGALLEVGTGFHPELTGRENIFLNGTILGMRRREVEKKFDEIVDFAEVERFIDTPVKRYSSGMYVRLAFAIAANLDPQILIVDEVLAVGDAKFQAKCLGKMKDIAAGEGRTVLFVSHAAAAVRQLCTKAVLLKNGQLELFGDVDQVIARYEQEDGIDRQGQKIVERAQTIKDGIALDSVTVNGVDVADSTIGMGPEDTMVEVIVKGHASQRLAARLGLYLSDSIGTRLGYFGEGLDQDSSPVVEAGPFEWRARVALPRTLTEGTYGLTVDVSHPFVQAWVVIDNVVQIVKSQSPDGVGNPVRYSSYGAMILDGTVERAPSFVKSAT